VDAALAGLALVLAFLTASFVARNSDAWLHLAAGQRLLAGQYTPGTDPFSYTAADRAWVNHSWLADAAAYLLYGGEGKVLVAAKALVVLAAFGLLIAIRRPQYPLWPWAAVACVAVLAAAPQFTLRPLVVSVLFLAVTLYLLFRVPHRPNSWRFPAAIGVTFWLWANCDQWFFLGPLALALVLVGNLIQAKFLGDPAAPAEDEEPLGRLPDTPTLAKALAVGLLACTLTPHHVRVWELPFELVGGAGAAADPRLQQQYLLAPYDEAYRTNARFGNNLNGLAYAVLLIGGAVSLGVGPGRVRAAHVALWVGFAALGLLSVAAVPFFAVVAVPLVAAQLNALGARAERRAAADPRGRALVIASSVGRVACVLGVCALCVAAYPGWLHPDPGNPAFARRVAWGVEADPALRQAAEQFRRWREAGALPADARGVVANLDLANYLAWFAPREKVFINSRPNHHRAELPDYVRLRAGLGLIEVKDAPPDPKEAADVLRTAGAAYLALQSDSLAVGGRADDAVTGLYRAWGEWSPWYLDGRVTVFGWRPPGAPGGPAFAALRVDPVALAVGPGGSPRPDPEPILPPPPLGWEEAFVRPARLAPAGVGETFGWLRYGNGLLTRQQFRQDISGPLAVVLPLQTTPPWHRLAMRVVAEHGVVALPPLARDVGSDADGVQAVPLLALRAARRAIAEDPDHPDGYFALDAALGDAALPLPEGERALGRVVALRQCLARMPAPGRYRPGQFAADPTLIALRLAMIYLEPRSTRIDPRTQQPVIQGFLGMPVDVEMLGNLLGQMVFEDATGRLRRMSGAELRDRGPPPNARLVSGNAPRLLPLDTARETLQLAQAYAEQAGGDTEAAKPRAQFIAALLKEVDAAMIRADEQFRREGPAVSRQVGAALNNGLTAKVLNLLSERGADLEKEARQELAAMAFLRIGLELALGQVENADLLLKDLDRPEKIAAVRQAGLGPAIQVLKYHTALHAGEYRAAGEALEAWEGRGVGLEPLVAELARNKINPNELLLVGFTNWPPTAANGGPVPAAAFQTALTDRARQAAGVYEAIANKLQSDARFFYRRGVLSLLEGDIPAARQRFLQTRREAPKGWWVHDVSLPEAERYLRLIDAAARSPAP
jgi:hypothetical protein